MKLYIITVDKGEPLMQQDTFMTRDKIVKALQNTGVQKGDVLLVHTSLSSIGWVCGGVQALAEALLEAVGEEGTIVLPTQSGDNSDPANWQRPAVPLEWQQEIRDTMPAFDPARTPSSRVGVLPELLRTFPGAVRSNHPTSSFAAIGKMAKHLMKTHVLEDAFGEASPLGALYQANAKILMIGVHYYNCTAFHLAEARLQAEPTEQNGSAVMENGKRVWKPYKEKVFNNEAFDSIGAAFEQETGMVQNGTIGLAMTKLFPLQNAVDFAQMWMTENKNDVKLVRLDTAMETEYKMTLDEIKKEDGAVVPASADDEDMPFTTFCKQKKKGEQWATCEEGLVPSTLYILQNNAGRILGFIDIRHALNEYLANYGGHIGYGVRPSERKKGYATQMLKMALPIAKSFGIEEVLITCKEENVASARVMEKNGGVYEDSRSDGTHTHKRYWFAV